MKGLSVVVTILLFVVAVGLSNVLKKPGGLPREQTITSAQDNSSQAPVSFVSSH